MNSLSRRDVLRGSGLAALAALLPAELLAGCTASRSAAVREGAGVTVPVGRTLPGGGRTSGGREGFLFFDAHQASVVEEATARLIPGPLDDPSEAGHPGAREAGVVRYIDTMLGALSLRPQAVFAGGPFSDRAGWQTDDMARFIGLGPEEAAAWKRRIAGWKDAYARGVEDLDGAARGDFTAAGNDERDAALVANPGGFTSLLFGHAIEGMYSPPEYGGNRDLVGWKDIAFPGDVQPRGFTPSEVTESDGPDPYTPDSASAKLLSLIAISNGR